MKHAVAGPKPTVQVPRFLVTSEWDPIPLFMHRKIFRMACLTGIGGVATEVRGFKYSDDFIVRTPSLKDY
jgi:hypothetical protein